MRIVIISDTHGYHDELDLPDGDVLIHCGDVSGRSDEQSIIDFAKWFDRQPHGHKIVIAGNHDRHMSGKYFHDSIHLEDDGVEIDGVKFWGSPWTPTFYDWYWMKDRGADIAAMWAMIPTDTDVLITHGPPSSCGFLSKAPRGVINIDVGCEDLIHRVHQVEPRLHCFGHIHEGYGRIELRGLNTTFINASIARANAPVVFDMPMKPSGGRA